MSNSVATMLKQNRVAKFDLKASKLAQAQIQAVIDYAARLQEWLLLDEAIAAKMEEQQEFVGWWREKVRRDGRPSKTSAGRGQFLAQPEAERVTGIKHQQVSRWAKWLASETEREKYRSKVHLAACSKAGLVPAENHRAEGTGENEWYTPAKYVDAARSVMGGIDLDPASSPHAQEWIQAAAFYTRVDDGLTKPWAGRVWLNPPYSQPEIFQFCEKLVAELSAGNVTEAVLLTHNYTDTTWFHLAESIAALICFTRGRIPFIDADGEPCSPTQGQAFFYYGENTERFRSTFHDFGFVR